MLEIIQLAERDIAKTSLPWEGSWQGMVSDDAAAQGSELWLGPRRKLDSDFELIALFCPRHLPSQSVAADSDPS